MQNKNTRFYWAIVLFSVFLMAGYTHIPYGKYPDIVIKTFYNHEI